MKVRATKQGVYPSNGKRFREVGDVFEIRTSKDLGSWMEPIDKPKPTPKPKPKPKTPAPKADKE